MNPKKQALKVRLSKGVLSISIGIDTLAFCAEQHPDVWLPETDKSRIVVSNAFKFAKEVKIALEQEEEDGTTPVHSMLDNAILTAWESGCEGLDYDAMEELEKAEHAATAGGSDADN